MGHFAELLRNAFKSLSHLTVLLGLLAGLAGVFFWVFQANQTHEMTVEHEPRLEALEEDNAEYQVIWAEAVEKRKRYIQRALEVCREAGECE